MNINVFLLFFSFVFLQIERERERERKRERERERERELMEFLWRIFPLLRANRLYAIFNTGLKKWLLHVRDIPFVFFYPEYLDLVPSATNPVHQLTFLLSISPDGKESPLPFWGPSQSFGFSLLPSRVRRPE